MPSTCSSQCGSGILGFRSFRALYCADEDTEDRVDRGADFGLVDRYQGRLHQPPQWASGRAIMSVIMFREDVPAHVPPWQR